jgi:hypothetical protein
MNPSVVKPRIIDIVEQVLIIAYREDTTQLEQAIAQMGLPVKVLRQLDRPEYQDYAAAYRCLLNHQQAWEEAARGDRPTMILEADFVPVVNMGSLPLPFDPHQENVGIAWLYTCAPQIYSVSAAGYIQGFSSGLVAYILTPKSAESLCGLVEEITRTHGTGYSTFDSNIDQFLRTRKFGNYIGFRNYGEHGGKSNPEHRRNGMSGIHRADVLYNQLAFEPQYLADESLVGARTMARIKGLGRLLMGKTLRWKIARSSSVPWRLVSTAIRRQLSATL